MKRFLIILLVLLLSVGFLFSFTDEIREMENEIELITENFIKAIIAMDSDVINSTIKLPEFDFGKNLHDFLVFEDIIEGEETQKEKNRAAAYAFLEIRDVFLNSFYDSVDDIIIDTRFSGEDDGLILFMCTDCHHRSIMVFFKMHDGTMKLRTIIM